MARNNVEADYLQSFNTTGLTTAFKAINTEGFLEAPFLIRIINDSDTDVLISYDGVAANDFIRSGSQAEFNFQTNSQPNNKVCLYRRGTVVYVAGVTQGAGTGLVYLAAYYQDRA